MRVLITRPEREATALATALHARGHVPVIAPLFRLDFLHPPAGFAEALAGCQAVLLTSANGARALAEASAQRSKPILAVGDTTAATAEGLGFTSVTSAAGDSAALTQLGRERLAATAGPLLHVSGVDVAGELAPELASAGFEVRRFALYEARAVTDLPDSARAALEARALDVATFFSPRAAELFARLAAAAGLSETCRNVTALAISPAALAPLLILPFKAAVAAAKPSRQAVLDEIDRLAEAGVQQVPARSIMSDTPSTPPPLRLTTPAPDPAPAVAPAPSVTPVRRGIGVIGAFIVGVVASVIVVAGALLSLPYWPEEARAMWRGPAAVSSSTPNTAAIDAAKQELTARLDDLDKRVRGLANTAAQSAPATPSAPDPAIAALRARLEALENKPAAPAAPAADGEKDTAALRLEIATLRAALQSLDQAVSGQKDQAHALADAIEKAKAQSSQTSADEQKAFAAARASTVIAIAARLSTALDQGRPFASDVALLAPLAQDDKKIAELSAALQPSAQAGVVPRDVLAADFPAVAKAAMADDLADDSFGQRVLGKVKGLVSLRRVGADVAGDTVEAKLARAEAALKSGDLAKATDLVKSLPPLAQRATQAWLARAETHLAAQQAVDQLAAYAVSLLGSARAQ